VWRVIIFEIEIFLKLNFDFIVAEIRGAFGSVEGDPKNICQIAGNRI